MPDVETLLATLWAWNPPAVGTAAAALVVVVLALLVIGISRVARGPGSVKLRVGNAVVQAAVAVAVVSGAHAYCSRVLGAPTWEAWMYALVLEACTWVAIGRIMAHGRSVDDQGKPRTGFGPSGPFFWLFSILGGILATVGAENPGAAFGRAVIVTFGCSLWYLTLLTYTQPSGTPSRWKWTPHRLLVAIGALEPADTDIADEHQEWQIRRIARAMRWANGRRPLRWVGRHTLISRAEQTSEHVIEAARRRYVVAHLLVTTIHPESDVMRRVIDAVQAEVTGAGLELERQRADLEAHRADVLADLERRRAELTQVQAPRPRVVPPAAAASAAGGDRHPRSLTVDQAVRDVAAFLVNARANNQPCGQRPVADQFKVSRARAGELITAAEQYLGEQPTADFTTPTNEPPRVNGARVPIPTT